MHEQRALTLFGPEATERFGRALGRAIAATAKGGLTLWLQGELGAGKTSLARAILRGLGYSGRVPSPTYTLIESYELERGRLHHVDLYRLQSPDEADFLGLSELPGPGETLLVEWPERAGDRVPHADLYLSLATRADGRDLTIRTTRELPPPLTEWLRQFAPVSEGL